MKIDTSVAPFLFVNHDETGRKGKEIILHTDLGLIDWNPENIDLIDLQQRAVQVGGENARFCNPVNTPALLGDQKFLNGNVLGFLMLRQLEIPEAWRQFTLVFWGTLLYNPEDQGAVVRYAYWTGDGWNWRYRESTGVMTLKNPVVPVLK